MSAEDIHLDDLPVLDTEVLVVGAGPTGLMAALVLSRRAIPSVVIDRKASPTKESRALAVQARTMEIYDQLGLAEQVLAGSFPAERMQIGLQGARLPDFVKLQGGATRFPGIAIFEQSRNEELLAETLAAEGGEIRWQHRLVDLTDNTDQSDGRVQALVEGADGTLQRIRARWCIGADGASSLVRRALNVPFNGTTDEATFWVADVRGVEGLPERSVNLRFGKSTFALMFPLGPGGHTRLISLAGQESITEDEALATADAEFGLSHRTVDWFSTYRVHHRVAATFRIGSVFLAGDAGHVHSPVGGQGMNTGLQDAHNLALLLADVADGRLEPQALDRYQRERRPVALMLVNVTDRMFGVVGRRGPLAALLRRRAGSVAARVIPLIFTTALGSRIGGYLGQYRIRYRYLPDAADQRPAWAADPVVGRRLPPVQANQQALANMSWQLHGYGSGAINRPDVPEWVDGPSDFGPDAHGRLRSDRLYLVRPDQFVAASIALRGRHADACQLRAALHAHRLVR